MPHGNRLRRIAQDWLRDAKFGVLVHQGANSGPAFGNDWHLRDMYISSNAAYRHQVAQIWFTGKYLLARNDATLVAHI